MARTRSYLILFLISACPLLLLQLSPVAACAAEDTLTWNVMVYMAADADPELPWEDDINEMESADLVDWIDVTVLVDPLGFGDSTILDITEDDSDEVISASVDDDSQVIPPSGEVDMASPSTLVDFIVFSVARQPADMLVLILWGHSGGWYGLCQDGSSVLRLPDLGEALRLATDELGRRIDIIVMDSCAEGVVETMYQIRDYVDWYVGSEMNVPAQGLRYDLVFDSLAHEAPETPQTWAADICRIHKMTLLSQSWSSTMAAFDMRALENYTDRLEDLSLCLQGYSSIYRSSLMGVLIQTAETDLVEWYLDAGDVLRRLCAADLPLEVRYKALEALRSYGRLAYCVEVYADPSDDRYSEIVNCTGMAMYAPSEDTADEPYWSTAFSSCGWGNATATIRNGDATVANLAPPEITYHDIDNDDAQEEATLHWDEDCDLYVVWIFVQTPAGMQLIDRLESADNDVDIEGYAGDLIVSASAWVDGFAVSCHELNMLLTKDVMVSARVVSGGTNVTEGLTVRLQTHSGMVHLVQQGDEFAGIVEVPEDVDYGELVTVQVVDEKGEVLAENRTFVRGHDVALEILLIAQLDDEPRTELVIPSALLISCAVIVTLYVWMRKRGTRP